MSSTEVQGQFASHHDDRSGQIAAVVSVMIVLATIAVALRLFTRWLIATSWKLDDYGIIAALVSICSTSCRQLVSLFSAYTNQVLNYGLFITQLVGMESNTFLLIH